MQATLERLRARRDERGDEGGFTLIELLIVIVILAILAAIVVFAVQNLTGSSAKASCESDVQTVDHAIQAYVAQMSAQPPTGPIAVGAGLMSGPVTGSNGDQVGPWLHNVPTNGTHYSVEVYLNGTTAYPIVVTPGAAPQPAFNANGESAIIYSPDKANALAANGVPAIQNTTSGACANVTS
jgi:general secretion pathway protein G